MSDNVTASGITLFTLWGIPIIAAFLGAAAALLLKEAWEYWKRPKLEIDFEKREGKKPYFPDYNDWEAQPLGFTDTTFRKKYLRLLVSNRGMKLATVCEAKIEYFLEGDRNTINRGVLHWSRRDPALFTKVLDNGSRFTDIEKTFSSIDINRNDEETLEVICLKYHFSNRPDEEHIIRHEDFLETASANPVRLYPTSNYYVKVTIYSSNTNAICFNLKVLWDGTPEGFNKAFTKA